MNSSLRKASRSSRGASASRTALATSARPDVPEVKVGRELAVASSSGWFRFPAYREGAPRNRFNARWASPASPERGTRSAEASTASAVDGGPVPGGSPAAARPRSHARARGARDAARDTAGSKGGGEANRPGRVLLFAQPCRRHQPHPHHRPDGTSSGPGRLSPPPLRLPKRILIAHHDARRRRGRSGRISWYGWRRTASPRRARQGLRDSGRAVRQERRSGGGWRSGRRVASGRRRRPPAGEARWRVIAASRADCRRRACAPPASSTPPPGRPGPAHRAA